MLPPCRFTGSEVGSVLHCLLKSVNVVQLGGGGGGGGMDLHRLIRYRHPNHPSLHNKHCLSCSHSDLISMFLPHPLPQAVLIRTFNKRDHVVRSSILLSAHSVFFHRLIRYRHPNHPSLHNKHCLSCSHSDLISMFLPHPLPQAVLIRTFNKRDHVVRSSILLSAHSVFFHRLIRYRHPNHPSLHNKHCLSCSHSDLISMFLPHPLPQAVLIRTFNKRDHVVRSSILLSAHSVCFHDLLQLINIVASRGHSRCCPVYAESDRLH